MGLSDQLENETLYTKTELEIIRYIKNNPQSIIHMTIGELAQATYSSNATITYSKQDVYRDSLRTLLYNHVPIITITSNADDILFQYSRYHILIPHKENNEKIATFYSQISFQYVLSILYSLLYKRHQKRK